MVKTNEQHETQLYKFTLPIGDWSEDGHGKCEHFLVQSAKPVEYVREVHYTIEEKSGINIHELCDDMDENHIPKSNPIYQQLKDIGFNWEDVDYWDDEYWLSPRDMANVWICLLNYCDEKLHLQRAYGEIPMLPFYGMDGAGRHIDFVGYGCWDF
jgi:hypothetical protein